MDCDEADVTGGRIWTYGESPESTRSPPGYIELCRRTVEKLNPDRRFTVLTPENLDLFIDPLPAFLEECLIDQNEDVARSVKTAFISARVLAKHGGLWVDPDCIAVAGFDALFEAIEESGFLAVEMGLDNGPRVSTRLMGARQGGDIITRYATALTDFLEACGNGEGLPDPTLQHARLIDEILDRAGDRSFKLVDSSDIFPLHELQRDLFGQIDFNRTCLDPIVGGTAVMLPHTAGEDNFNRMTASELLWSPFLLGAIFRHVLQPPLAERATPAPCAGMRTPAAGYDDIALIFTTMKRPDACIEFVKSIRSHWPPGIGIYIAVQGDPLHLFEEIAELDKVNLFSVPEDYGLSASRNFLLDRTREPVILLGDDDLVVTKRTCLDVALDIWNRNAGIRFLGGMFDNFHFDVRGNFTARHFFGFENMLVRHPLIPKSTAIYPSEYFSPELHYVNMDHYFHFADTVNNFVLMDRAYMNRIGLRWDDEMLIGSEHTDFYLQLLQLKEPGEQVVAFTNALVVEHRRIVSDEYNALRKRKDFYIMGMRKWDNTSWHTVGKYAHRIVGIDEFETVRLP